MAYSTASTPHGIADDQEFWRLLRLALLDPAFEHLDPFRRPCTVAGHRAALEDLGDRGSVGLDIGVRPQIECSAHRVAILLSEQRLDVGVEADLGWGHGH